MRRLLDGLYRLSGWLAAASIAAICALVCAQVGLNVADTVSSAVTARSLGLSIPSYADLAGYLLAAASFLALAPTWRSGGHIRVTLILERLHGRSRRWAELWALSLVTGMTAFLAYHAGSLGIESWQYGDLSPGLVPVPLWWPQSIMALGLTILLIAQVDGLIELVSRRSGRTAVASTSGADREPAPAGG